jgi:hypothetical protein
MKAVVRFNPNSSIAAPVQRTYLHVAGWEITPNGMLSIRCTPPEGAEDPVERALIPTNEIERVEFVRE